MSTESERLQEMAQKKNYKAIYCEKIPELFLDKLVAKKHFSKFGKINRFIFRPKRLICTVEYETEKEAEKAYHEARNFNGIEFIVNYADQEVAHIQNTEEWVDPEVQAELEAMNPNQRFSSNMRATAAVPTASSSFNRLSNSNKSSNKSMESTTGKVAKTALKEGPAVNAMVRQDLEAVLKKPALNDEDKYRVLEARDKLLRLTSVKQTDIKKAVAIRGICPDMCPEKERLMREFQHQVSIFELADDNDGRQKIISHSKAIKEYSRSSADQEVPLAHELRPESVLQMTMLYLMHNIMDLCDDPQTSLQDWFHFVWDRTRSIRKDITQQELCSLAAVELVEQCARFHIHCAARLISEEPSVFDKKINAENLTKCLQTLKYMYHDLRLKGIHCPKEVEFRSYIVLLNLGDANFLWELKQLPECIQKAPEIKKAIAFYNALQNNNYVRFFSMIKSKQTSYLSSCILLGYFNKLRLRAMEAIIKAHNAHKMIVFLPLTYLTKILAFEDIDAARSFFTCHGLECNEVEDRVLLGRLTKPDFEYIMDRALNLVESKRCVSVGECVCGGTLPSKEQINRHKPHNSFDANSLLKPNAWSAEDQLRGKSYASEEKKNIENVQKPTETDTTITTTIATTTITTIFPTTITATITDENLFKIPFASPPTIFKQHQQQHHQKQHPQKSIFSMVKQKEEATENHDIFRQVGDFKFDGKLFSNSNNKNNNNDLGSNLKPPISTSFFTFANTTLSSKSHGDKFFDTTLSSPKSSYSIFSFSKTNDGMQQQIEKPISSSYNIFPTSASKSAIGTSPPLQKAEHNSGTNIFGFNPKFITMKNIFHSDKLFQHYQTTMPQEMGKHELSSISSGCSIKQIEEMEQRQQELEEAQAQQQQRLEDERKKLKILEAQKVKQTQLQLQLQIDQKAQKQQQIETEREQRKAGELLSKRIEETAQQYFTIISTEMLEAEIFNMAQEEKHKYQILNKAAEELLNKLLEVAIQDVVNEVANDEYRTVCHSQILLNKYFTYWLKKCRRHKQQREIIDDVSVWITTNSHAQYAYEMHHPGQNSNMEMVKRYRLGQPCDFKQLLWFDSLPRPPKHLLNLFDLIGHHLLQQQLSEAFNTIVDKRQYFKLLLTLPDDQEELPGYGSYCNKWLIKNIEKAQLEIGPFLHGLERNVALCVRKVSGRQAYNEQGDLCKREMDHCDGIICFISGSNGYESSRQRIVHLLNASRNYKRISLAIIAYNCAEHNADELAKLLNLDTLRRNGLIAEYKCFGCQIKKNEFSLRQLFTAAVHYVARYYHCHQMSDDDMAMDKMKNILEICLGEELWQKLLVSSYKNPIFRKICTMPEYIVNIFNLALEQITAFMCDRDLSRMPEFPYELKEFVPTISTYDMNVPLTLEYFPSNWKSLLSPREMKKLLINLKMPIIEPCDVPNNVEDMKLFLLNYACKCMPHDDDDDDDDKANNDIIALEAAQLAIREMVKQLQSGSDIHDAFDVRLKFVNFLFIMKPIVFGHINYQLKNISNDILSSDIIYLQKDFNNYKTLPWWLNYEPLGQVKVNYSDTMNSTSNKNNDGREELLLSSHDDNDDADNVESMETVMEKAENICQEFENKIIMQNTLRNRHCQSSNCNRLKRNLDESLYKFEVAQKIGYFNTSHVKRITDELDETLNELEQRSEENLTTSVKKRKYHKIKTIKDGDDDSSMNEIKATIKNAMALVEQLEELEDRKKRLRSLALHNQQ